MKQKSKRIRRGIILVLSMVMLLPAISGYAATQKQKAMNAYKKWLGQSKVSVLKKGQEIADYNGDGAGSENSLDDDSLIVTYKWLTIKAKTRDNNLTIIAEPNPTGKSRKLYIYGDVTNQFAEIKVTQ